MTNHRKYSSRSGSVQPVFTPRRTSAYWTFSSCVEASRRAAMIFRGGRGRLEVGEELGQQEVGLDGPRGEQAIESRRETPARLVVRPPQPGACQRIGAQQVDAIVAAPGATIRRDPGRPGFDPAGPGRASGCPACDGARRGRSRVPVPPGRRWPCADRVRSGPSRATAPDPATPARSGPRSEWPGPDRPGTARRLPPRPRRGVHDRPPTVRRRSRGA